MMLRMDWSNCEYPISVTIHGWGKGAWVTAPSLCIIRVAKFILTGTLKCWPPPPLVFYWYNNEGVGLLNPNACVAGVTPCFGGYIEGRDGMKKLTPAGAWGSLSTVAMRNSLLLCLPKPCITAGDNDFDPALRQ